MKTTLSTNFLFSFFFYIFARPIGRYLPWKQQWKKKKAIRTKKIQRGKESLICRDKVKTTFMEVKQRPKKRGNRTRFLVYLNIKKGYIRTLKNKPITKRQLLVRSNGDVVLIKHWCRGRVFDLKDVFLENKSKNCNENLGNGRREGRREPVLLVVEDNKQFCER